MDCKAVFEKAVASAVFLFAAITQAAGNMARSAEPASKRDGRGFSDAPAVDQANDAMSIGVTAEIRRAAITDRTLSTSGHNVLVITDGNTVTLRGAVASAAGKRRIDAVACQLAAGKQIRNQLTLSGG